MLALPVQMINLCLTQIAKLVKSAMQIQIEMDPKYARIMKILLKTTTYANVQMIYSGMAAHVFSVLVMATAQETLQFVVSMEVVNLVLLTHSLMRIQTHVRSVILMTIALITKCACFLLMAMQETTNADVILAYSWMEIATHARFAM